MKLSRLEQKALEKEARIADRFNTSAAQICLIETDDPAVIAEIEGRLGTSREAVIRFLQRKNQWGSVEAVRQSLGGTQAEQIAALRTAFAAVLSP